MLKLISVVASFVIAMLIAIAPGYAAKTNCVNKGRFDSWMAAFKKEALEKGVSRRTVKNALSGIRLDKRIIARDRRQGFFGQSFGIFSKKLATNHRLNAGRKKIKKNKAIFARAQKKYGVPPEVITAFWALESDFGIGMGDFPVLRSLATLAYDCRRSEMFREELTAALQIIDRGDLRPGEMIGSWAGELGQTQFLPQHYLNHAVDFNGDGRRDLFRSNADIIGSTAAFIQHLGWKSGEPWIREVRLTRNLPWQDADLKVKHPHSKWSQWGVKLADGSPLPGNELESSLLIPMGRRGPAFLAYDNFKNVYLQWNESLNYSTTAAYLATRIGGAPTMRGRERDIPVLSLAQAKEMQRILQRRGYDVGKVDGIIGAKTRAAVKAMQIKYKMPPDSYPTPALLSRLRRR